MDPSEGSTGWVSIRTRPRDETIPHSLPTNTYTLLPVENINIYSIHKYHFLYNVDTTSGATHHMKLQLYFIQNINPTSCTTHPSHETPAVLPVQY
jgi:hypothetical protein